jgi:hypothetical protein
MAIGDGYNPSTITNPGAQAAVDKLTSDPDFRSRYFSEDKYVRDFAVTQMEIAQKNAAARSYYVPDQASANTAGDKIKAAFADKLFQERYNSNDPRVRSAAIDEMSKLFFDKYGNMPNSDEAVQNTPRPVAANPSPAPAPQPRSPQYIRSGAVARNSEAWKVREYGTAYLNAVAANGGRPLDV